MNKKKILFITPSIWAGGTHSSLCSIVDNFDRNKWDIDVFAIVNIRKRECSYSNILLKGNFLLTAITCKLSDANGIRKYIIAIIKLANRIVRQLHIDMFIYTAKHVARKLQQYGDYDTVVGFMEGCATIMASYFDCNNKIAWIHCNYNKYLPEGKSEEGIYNNFNHIVCVSEYTSNVFKDRYHKLADRTICIYNIFDSEKIKKLSKEIIDDDRFNAETFTILSVGRVTGVKRFSQIPLIVERLKSKGLRFHWYLIGPEIDKIEGKTIVDNVSKYRVSDCFTWLGGKLNPYPYFKSSNLYVCVSESEACPMVFNEARIFGLPIVSTNFPSAKEFITDGEDGALVEIEVIVEAIAERITNSDLYRYESQRSKDRYFDNSAILKQIEIIV